MTSDSECSYVANLADFNVIRVIVIVIKIVYNSKSYSNNGNKIVIIIYTCKNSNNSNSYSNNGNKIVIIIYTSKKSNHCTHSNNIIPII